MKFANKERIKEIAPAITTQTAMLFECIISNFNIETERQKQDGYLYFLGMRGVLEAQGIITPQQSIELWKYAESFMKGGEN